MYVVRFSLPGREATFKAFPARAEALRWFVGAEFVICSEGSELMAALFDVPDEVDARGAVAAVKAGRATILDRYPIDGTPRKQRGLPLDPRRVREWAANRGIGRALAKARTWQIWPVATSVRGARRQAFPSRAG